MNDFPARRYGLVGRSLSYSFSKAYFTKKFQHEEISAVYENHELPNIEAFKGLDLTTFDGLNVTIPYKEAILPYLAVIDPVAEKVGAVNTIQLKSGRAIGHNTDVFGFRESLRPFLKGNHQKALILGTGGASKAVAYVLQDIGLDYLFVSRTPSGPTHIGYDELNAQAVRIFPFIINTTPVGTSPDVDDRPTLPYEALDGQNFLYDLVYNPAESAFLRAGREAGAQTMNGLRMLELQAEKSWQIWNEQN